MIKPKPSKSRALKTLNLLKNNYSQAKIVLKYKNNWELLVAVILSAQCTDKIVNKVTKKLFLKYKTLDDYIKADLSVFEKDVRSTGFYKNKAKNIINSAKIIKTKHQGKIPQTMEELINLPGVARKTANIVLGNAFNIVVGIAVDTHVKRLSLRLELTKETNPVKIEKDLMALFPKKD
ncbi:endonuclease III domain-containing protein [Patescibacteria group bacterium]